MPLSKGEGARRAGGGSTIYNIISQYLEYLELEKGLSQNTIDAYRRDLYSFTESGAKSIEDIDRNYINN